MKSLLANMEEGAGGRAKELSVNTTAKGKARRYPQAFAFSSAFLSRRSTHGSESASQFCGSLSLTALGRLVPFECIRRSNIMEPFCSFFSAREGSVDRIRNEMHTRLGSETSRGQFRLPSSYAGGTEPVPAQINSKNNVSNECSFRNSKGKKLRMKENLPHEMPFANN
ncbi:hypothetical protein CDAR_50991 [Caerostris darwini]|uniref:Uncharacterized protein n=1 Tax=Caerostris darwini TaxID=1538125 RepID=A0AAV4U5Y3_9ARAC|nr:hypothetical protein CDAR_50991 [Caerostris darwini]